MREESLTKKPSFGLSLFAIGILIVNIIVGIRFLGSDPHIPMIFSGVIVGIIAMVVLKFTWQELEEGITETIKRAMGPILILMIVGTVIGAWIASGAVPTMIYYGIKILSPEIFLVATLLICSVTSLAIGSSWTTAATVGVALMGVGMSLGIPVPVIGGAIISGSYFGDKLSPLSDTTNLAAAIAGVKLADHIKHMTYTVIPSYIISLGLFAYMGMGYEDVVVDQDGVNALLNGLSTNFTISLWLLLIPGLTMLLVALKKPPLLVLFLSGVLGSLVAVYVQGMDFKSVIDVLHYGYSNESGNKMIDELVNRGGLDSMMWTVSLILSALIYAGIVDKSGMIATIAEALIKVVRTRGSLVATTIGTSVGVNLTTSEQYLSLILPGTMYKKEYEKANLANKNLSRVLEDGGTLTSPLIPWNSCGAFMIATLGLSPWTYVPYAFLNIINPLVSIFYGYTGITMDKRDEEESTENQEELEVQPVKIC